MRRYLTFVLTVVLAMSALVAPLSGMSASRAASAWIPWSWHPTSHDPRDPAANTLHREVRQADGGAENEGENILAREKYWRDRHGSITAQDFHAAVVQGARLPRSSTLPPATDGQDGGKGKGVSPKTTTFHSMISSTSGSGWSALGPAPINNGGNYSGRITSLAVDPTTSGANTVIYAGAADGGVWKSSNNGASWKPLTDGQQSLAIGAVTIDPTNHTTIYAGTGEPNGSGDSYYGSGVLKSTDAGATWTLLGTSFFGDRSLSIFKIVVDSSNNQRVYAASTGGLGVSNDGGASWSIVAGGLPIASTDDLGVDRSTIPNTVYATVRTKGLYKTTDGGTTWTQLTTGLPAASAWNQRSVLAVAPSNPQVVYLMLINASYNVWVSGSYNGGYYTTDGGTTWSSMASLNSNFVDGGAGSQGWYDIYLSVDPQNDQIVYGGGVDIAMTTNARGTSGNWQNITNVYSATANSGIHPDQHAIAFPACSASPCPFYAGNDGGIFYTANPTAGSASVTYTNLNTAGLAITEFVGGDGGSNFHNTPLALAGSQDNGTEKYTGNTLWNEVWGGDGGFTAINPTSPSTMYTENYYASVKKSIDGGTSWTSASSGLPLGSGNSLFYSPYALDHTDTQHLIWGGNQVYESTNGASTWYRSNSTSIGYYISAVAVAPSNSAVMYAGTAGNGSTGGQMWKTTTGHTGATTTWSEVNDAPFAHNYINGIAVDPADPTIAYVVTGKFYSTRHGVIYKTTDGGSTWSDITGSLPTYPINTVVEYRSGTSRTVVIGTDYGIYYTTDDGGTWFSMTSGLPNVVVNHLAMDSAQTSILAFTHGRSAFSTSVAAPHFSVSAPATAGAGTPISVTVTAVSAFGDVDSAYRGTVQVTSSDGAATLPANYTFTSADGGTHTFTVTLKTSGSQTIAATDAANAAMTGTSNMVTVIQPTTITLQAGAGWNMVGGSPLTLWSDSQVNWSFNASTPAWFTPTVTAPTGTGAWEYVSTAGARTVTVVSCPTPVTVPVTAHRWNLVGNPCSRSVSLPSTSRAYWWDPSAQHYVLVTSITPGAAAWVKPDTTTLTLS